VEKDGGGRQLRTELDGEKWSVAYVPSAVTREAIKTQLYPSSILLAI